MNPKRTVLLLAIALLANLGLVAVTTAFVFLGRGVFGGRHGFRVIVAVPTISALVSFLWILSCSASVKSVRGRIVLAIAGTLFMMAMFLVLFLPAWSAGMELSNKLHRAFPNAFYSPDERLSPK